MKRIQIASLALGILGLAAPAFAHEGSDDHDAYHEELEAQHAADHAQLDTEHEQFHAGNDAAYARALQACGWDARCRWLAGRRFERRHRLVHLREALEHVDEHEQLATEHDIYHQVSPGASYPASSGDAPAGVYGYPPPAQRYVPRGWRPFGRY